MIKPRKYGKIAFITTPEFRKSNRDLAESFVYRHMYSLCNSFNVITTGGTYKELLLELLRRPLKQADQVLIEEDTRFSISSSGGLGRWRDTVRGGLKPTMSGYKGMIRVANELVEGRLDAVIHLTDWVDKSAKPDSAVL